MPVLLHLFRSRSKSLPSLPHETYTKISCATGHDSAAHKKGSSSERAYLARKLLRTWKWESPIFPHMIDRHGPASETIVETTGLTSSLFHMNQGPRDLGHR
jgi:hypothetical protein